MEISTKKISHMRFSFKTELRLGFLPPFTGDKKWLEFPLNIHKKRPIGPPSIHKNEH